MQQCAVWCARACAAYGQACARVCTHSVRACTSARVRACARVGPTHVHAHTHTRTSPTPSKGVHAHRRTLTCVCARVHAQVRAIEASTSYFSVLDDIYRRKGSVCVSIIYLLHVGWKRSSGMYGATLKRHNGRRPYRHFTL